MQLMQCLTNNKPHDLLMLESDLTVAEAMDGVQLRNLSKAIEKKNVVKAIAYLTIRLSENFNVGKKFTSEQASLMALDLFDVFGYETLEDVVLMFKYARQGRIGDGKDFKLDSQTVFHKWVPEYLELKAIEREHQHTKQKGEKNGMANFKWKQGQAEKIETSDTPQTFREGLGTRKRREDWQRASDYVEWLTEEMTPEDLEKEIESWEKDPKKKYYVKLLKAKRRTV